MQNNKWLIGGSTALAVVSVLGVLFMVQVFRLNMIPLKYLVLLCVFIGALLLVLGIFLLRKEGKYQCSCGHKLQIFAMVAAGLCSVGFLFGISAVAKLSGTMSAVTDAPAVSADTVSVDVYVKKEDPVGQISQAGSYIWGCCMASEKSAMEQALAQMEQELGRKPEIREFASETEMIQNLFAGEIQGVLLNGAYLHILSELEGFQNFQQEVRLLQRYTIELQPTQPPETEPATQPADPDGDKPKQPNTLVVYLSGSDVRAKDLIKYKGRSDVNILLVANLDTHEILLINTPRDYYVPNHAYGDREDKLTHCGINGVDNSIYVLQQLYDVQIPYYAQINFAGFETLIDALGGIIIESDTSFHTVGPDPVYIQKGENYLDGHDALAYARERHAFASGDLARGEHQMQVIRAVIQKLSTGSILTGYYDILDSLKGMFLTTIPQAKIAELVKMQLDGMPSWHVSSYSVSGKLTYRSTATSGGLELSVILPDEGMLQHGQMLVDKVLAGETLTEQDLIYG